MKKEYVDFFSALLTPLIAVVMTYIALQQYRANRLKLRQNLYDRRFALYNATAEFLAYIFSHGAVDNQQLFPFLQRTRESYFLFGPDVADYVTTLHKKAVHACPLKKRK